MVTHSLSIYGITQTNSITISFFNSTYEYITTMFIYYEYTFIDYTLYYLVYSNFFTFYNQNQGKSDESKLPMIIAICASVALVIIICVIAIVVIRKHNRKSNNAEEQVDSLDGDYGTETVRDFSLTGPQFSDLKVDPFAEDFNEDETL
ncbi:hypothetical protein GPJ56_005024 [Histomonas meleagridis]|uniref:uncharacterized protein n=1 Tax=Histomonas meleagridis TaxID=135588 RepID=UPI003559C7D5|nr:hypothetical protein GPJ56_005024 [Histomonas meleagridis]KAH0802542.1 hypothetical protein GO595_004591 [Histomonas meleagridis]